MKNKLIMVSRVFIKLPPTFCIAAGGDFENRLTGGDDEKKYDYKIIEKILRKSQVPNQSW